ncbi:BLUF domain-containing protein, partial [Huaxiibacter chinensis]
MLTTLIYRSQLNTSCKSIGLEAIIEKAKRRNSELGITGILLFN